MVPTDRDESLDLTLESILDEYRGFDPEAPEETPMPEAAFASKVAEAELIDAGPDELLTPEALMELAPEEAEAEALFSDEAPAEEDAFAAGEAEPEAADLDELLEELLRDEPEDEDDDVRAYYPHGQEPEEEAIPEAEVLPEEEAGMPEALAGVAGAAGAALTRIKTLAMRFVDAVAPVEPDTPARPEDAEPVYDEVLAEEEVPLLSEEETPLSPEQPTQVFQTVADTFGEEDLSAELPQDEEFWAQVLAEEEAFYAHARTGGEDEDGEAEPGEAESYSEAYEYDGTEGDEYDEFEDEDYDEDEYEEVERRSFQEAVIRPITARLASFSVRLRERREERREEAAQEEDLGPEPTARLAHRYYASREGALRSRSRLALAVTLVLLYLTSGLPVLGLLRNSPRVMAMMCVLLQLVVMLIGLDVLTVGLTSFKTRRLGIESLVLLGCVFSLIDGVLCAVSNSLELGMPYCAVSALAVTFLIESAFCRARGHGATFFALKKSDAPVVFTAGTNEEYSGLTLAKSRRSAEGFIHRTEEPGPDAVTFAVLTPYLIAVGVVLSLLATVLSGSIRNAGHIFAGIFAAAAPLVAILIWTSPFRRLATFLQPKGLAIAGWSGASDIGRSKRFVVTDKDLFAPNCIKLEEPEFAVGMSEAKSVAYAAAMIEASGCCLAPAFRELAESYHYPILEVEDFECKNSPGISGVIHGEEVLLGTSEFMRLHNILNTRSEVEEQCTLYVAINRELCAIFPVKYHAQRNIENALHYLLRSKEKPVFAVRDPNIDPRMLKRIFHTQTDNFTFPTIPTRYELSDPYRDEEESVCGIINRTGLAPLLTITKTGRQLCKFVRGGLLASLVVLALGVLMMFWMCSTADFATCSAFHLAVYELVTALIVPIINYFVRK